ncbi:hypothetical protein HYV30_00600 [Candidatus Kaiserbacteria bacterium]|nr:hypothetical protein [Candidatus Kaiserbacteria bacterium]
MGELEYTSVEPVTPWAREEHESALDAMVRHGVQVYFVDPETFARIQTSPDHGYDILKTLESENQRRGVNATDLPGTEA